jgi:hypothetical protein
MQVKKGDFVIVDVDTVDPGQKSTDQNKPQSKEGVGSPQELERAPDQIETPELDIGGKSGAGYERSGNIQKGGSSKKYSSQKSLGQGGTKAEASAKWENALRDAISRAGSTLSDKARRLLTEL